MATVTTSSTSASTQSQLESLPTDAITYADLYARWERGNWRATELDFSEDARQWREDFTEFERQAALWNYCLFFWGEDAVADNLSPYIDAAPLEEQKYFLATQQVDEARHAVFFKRFMQEVCGIGDGSMASGLNAIKPQLTLGFRKVFDRLDTMADELRKDRSRAKLAAAVTLYHIIIESSLAQPGQHFICSYLEERNQLPAFREGMENIATDEQRHIVLGVREGPSARDPETVALVFDTIRRQVNPNHGLRRPTTYQWDFTDSDIPSWHLTVDNGSSAVGKGDAPRADLHLRVSWQDWADMVGQRLDPFRAVATGKLRPRGNPLALARLSKVFPRSY